MTSENTTKLTIREFAAAVGRDESVVRYWITTGELKTAGKRGRKSLLDASEVERMKSFPRKKRRTNIKASKSFGSSETVYGSAAAAVAAEQQDEDDSPVATASVVTLPVDGHRYPAPRIERGGARTLTFGPVSVQTVTDNSVEGHARIPAVDVEFKLGTGEAIILANALANRRNTWIHGPTGAGKTSGIKYVCGLTNWPLYRVNMHGDFSFADFVGTTEVATDEHGNAVTKFVPGVLIQAMVHGGVLLIDEFTATPPHILLALQAILEGFEVDGELTYTNTANGGEVVHAHPNFRVIVTDNTNGQGDTTGAYAGTNVMNEATRNRFQQWFHKDYPKATTWRSMLVAKTGCDADDARKIVEIAQEVNKGSSALGASTVTSNLLVSPRDTLKVGALARDFGDLQAAFKIALVDSLGQSDPDRQFLVDLLKNVLGVGK